MRKMAESSKNQSDYGKAEEDDDYMGDLSLFLPPESSVPSKISSKKVPSKPQVDVQPFKKPKKLNWQEQRKLDRERKQLEEDKQTIARIEAPIPQSNIGFKLLKQMGYNPGSALGKEGSGLAEPVGIDIRRSRAGIGREDPQKEKLKKEEIEAEKRKRKVENLLVDYGSRQKSQWRMRRVVINFKKANAALDQLENKEVMVPKKSEDEEEGGEEEEEITEEDLRDILMKLRDEHRYCLFCGFQYESTEALLSNCPGMDEDDH